MSPSKASFQSDLPLSWKILFDSLIDWISSDFSDSSDCSSLTTDSRSPCLSSTFLATSLTSFSAPDKPAVTTAFCFSCSASNSAFSDASASAFAVASASSAAFCSACFIAILAAVSSATCFANASRSNSGLTSGVLLSSDILVSVLSAFASLDCSIFALASIEWVSWIKSFLNWLYSSMLSNDFASEKTAFWLQGTETTDTSNSSASFILYPSVSSL